MTTEQKIKYIQSLMKTVVDAETYADAYANSCYLRGMLGAWNADMTITLDTYRQFKADIDTVMDVKRKLSAKGV